MIKQQNLTNIHNINYNIKINLYSLQGGNIWLKMMWLHIEKLEVIQISWTINNFVKK